MERSNDEITVAWTVEELNPDWRGFRVEYRAGENSWTAVDAKGSPAGSTRFRSAENGAISVRVRAYDLAGNRAEDTKNLAAVANVLPGTGSNIQTARFQPPPNDLVIPPPGGGNVPTPPVPIGTSGTRPAPSVDPEFRNTDPRHAPYPGSSGITPSHDNYVPPQPQPTRNEIPSDGSVVNSANLPPLQVINVARFDVAFDVENKGPSGVSRAEIYVTAR